MKWYTPLIIVGSFLLLFAFFGEPGTPALSYGTSVTHAGDDSTNLTLTYTVAMTVKNTGTAAADNTIVTVYLKTPPGAPEWQQNEILFPVGRLAKGELTTHVDTTTLTVGKEAYLFLTNGTLPDTTIVATYSDAFF